LAGKTPKQAVENFLAPIRRALSCITRSFVISGFDPNSSKPHVLTINNGDAVKLNSTPILYVTVQMQYRVVEAKGDRGPWKVTTAAYNYSIQDRLEKEIIAYYWHPTVKPFYPHLHVCPATGVNLLRKIHLPTARISIEDVLQLLVEQFKVKPIRQDWKKVLMETKGVYENFRTWS